MTSNTKKNLWRLLHGRTSKKILHLQLKKINCSQKKTTFFLKKNSGFLFYSMSELREKKHLCTTWKAVVCPLVAEGLIH
jgi:hypothetical protein